MVNKNKVCVSLVVAAAKNRVIGRNNELPWHLPKDLGYFKRVTTGKVVLMGRKTFESIGRPLPNRINIVVTRQAGWKADGIHVENSLDRALDLARRLTCERNQDEVMVIGGAQIYADTLPIADKLYLTEVQAEVEGDAFFPEVTKADWQEQWRENHTADGVNPYSYSFVVLERAQSSA